jgi:hypothetical protein
MSDPIHARYLLNDEETAASLVAHQRVANYPLKGIVGHLLFGVLCLLTLLFVAVLALETQAILREPVLQGLFLTVGMLWLVLILTKPNNFMTRRALRRQIASMTEEERINEFLFSEVEVKASSRLTTSIHRWAAIQRVVETPRGFLFYLNAASFMWLPSIAFSSADDLRRFAELAKSRVSHYVVTGPCQFERSP